MISCNHHSLGLATLVTTVQSSTLMSRLIANYNYYYYYILSPFLFCRMDNFASDSDYRNFNAEVDGAPEQTVPPSRYITNDPEKQARSQARAEARRTRRTLRLQQQQQQHEQRKLENVNAETHYKISYDGESSDGSSVDENYEVDSIAESIPENLT